MNKHNKVMTKAELQSLKEEISRLEDIQLEKLTEKKTANVGDVHNKLRKLRNILAREEGRPGC